jgi:hypothetical protein
MSKAIQEIVADLRKADMFGTGLDAGHIADQIELAFTELEDKWRQRVKDALAVADQFKGALDHVLNGLLFAQQKGAATDGKA